MTPIANPATPSDLAAFKLQGARSRKNKRVESGLIAEIQMRLQAMYGSRVKFGRNNSGSTVAEYKGRKRFIKFGMGDGASDIILCLDGRFVAIEAKTKGGRTSNTKKCPRLKEQIAYVNDVRAAGGLAGFADEWADVVNIINGGEGAQAH